MTPNWRYFAAKRRRESATGRVTIDLESRPSPLWQALKTPTGIFVTDEIISTHAEYSAFKEKYMSMSRDRVRFVIQTYGADNATRLAYNRAFNTTFPNAPMGQNVTIVCRPSQFARFLIYRNEGGGRNMFKELEPTLFTPQPKIDEFDVSGNPA